VHCGLEHRKQIIIADEAACGIDPSAFVDEYAVNLDDRDIASHPVWLALVRVECGITGKGVTLDFRDTLRNGTRFQRNPVNRGRTDDTHLLIKDMGQNFRMMFRYREWPTIELRRDTGEALRPGCPHAT
jgi:hypothetical protein